MRNVNVAGIFLQRFYSILNIIVPDQFDWDFCGCWCSGILEGLWQNANPVQHDEKDGGGKVILERWLEWWS